VLASAIPGLAEFGVALPTLRLTVMPLGSATALVFAAKSGHSSSRLDVRLVLTHCRSRFRQKCLTHKKPKPVYVVYE